MKKIFLITLLLSLTLWSQKTSQIQAPENTALTGRFQIQNSGQANLDNLPKIPGLEWTGAGVKSGSTYINGRYTSYNIIDINFKVSRPGAYTIPSFKVGDIHTEEHNFTVLPSPYAQLYFTELKLLNSDKALYPGQFFSIEYKVYLEKSLTFRGNIPNPEIQLEGIKLNTYPNRRNGQEHIQTRELSEETINGKVFQVYTYIYGGMPLLSGKYKGSISHSAQILKRRNTPGLRSDIVLSRLAEIPEFHVNALPEPPQNALPTSLVGHWKLSASIDKEKVEAGTPFTLTYTFTGQGGSIDRLTKPSLKMAKFRHLKATKNIKQTSINDSQAELNYFLAPLGSDVILKPISFSTFDPVTKKYVIHTPEIPKIEFTGPKYQEKKLALPANQTEPSKVISKIPDLDHDPTLVRRPILLNIHPLWWLSVLLFPIMYILKLLFSAPPCPKKLKKQKLRRLCRILKKADTQYSSVLFSDQLLPLLAEIQDLPKSTPSSELIQSLADSKLKTFLEDYDSRRFASGIRVPLNGSKLASLLKLLCLVPLFLSATSAPLNKLWEKRDFQQSETYLRKELQKTPNKVSLHYNLGLCLRQLDKPREALASFATGLRLSPRHKLMRLQMAEIMNELDFPQDRIEKLNTSLSYLRPDELIKLAILFWSLAFVLLLTLKTRKPTLISLLLILAIGFAFLGKNHMDNYWKRNQYIAKSNELSAHEFLDASDDGISLNTQETVQAIAINEKAIQIMYHGKKLWIKRSDLIHFW